MTYTAKPTKPNTHKNSRTHSHLLYTHPHPSWPLYTTYQHTQYTHTLVYTHIDTLYIHTRKHTQQWGWEREKESGRKEGENRRETAGTGGATRGGGRKRRGRERFVRERAARED